MVIFLSLLIIIFRREARLEPFVILFTISILNICYFFIIYFFKDLRIFAFVQIAADFCFAGVLIYTTGGVDSPFTFLYFGSVLGASLLFSLRLSIIFAVLAMISLTVITIEKMNCRTTTSDLPPRPLL